MVISLKYMGIENNFGPGPKAEEETQESASAPMEKEKYTPLTEAEIKRAEFELDENEIDNFIKKHPYEDVPMEMRHDYKEGKAEAEELLEKFKQNHSLEALHSISEITPELEAVFGLDLEKDSRRIALMSEKLSPEEAEKYKIRTAAKRDYSRIFKALDNLKKKTTIPEEEYDKLNAELKLLMLAIGRVNGDKILHTLH